MRSTLTSTQSMDGGEAVEIRKEGVLILVVDLLLKNVFELVLVNAEVRRVLWSIDDTNADLVEIPFESLDSKVDVVLVVVR
ncbi:hypothetical protein D9V37_16405 [Nocardioides mangrovicus]|uniref:Uncharacterized protein n=1 Tax=Nocardioides mangrovicus TaxID=2478913 RepID=A0A3L8NX25_9ACTN|nr:hypothetical protein D9V37_16405 [Nocardioides mangrovicus]